MSTHWDIIIIGGGVAGMTAAQYGARANLRTLMIEEMACGGQGLLIDALENYPGFPETINGYDFGERLKAQTLKFGASIEFASVQGILRKDKVFEVDLGTDVRQAKAVILATGAHHRKLGVPGENELYGRGVSYCATCDGPFFKGKPVMVVGGGDAACDEAMYPSKLCDRITMVHRRDSLRAQKAIAARTLANPAITPRLSTVVREIHGAERVESVVLEDLRTGSRSEERVDAVFIFVGSDPQTALLPDVTKDQGGYVITDQSMATSIPGIFAAGDVRASPFRQIVVAAGEGAIAAHSAAYYIESL